MIDAQNHLCKMKCPTLSFGIPFTLSNQGGTTFYGRADDPFRRRKLRKLPNPFKNRIKLNPDPGHHNTNRSRQLHY